MSQHPSALGAGIGFLAILCCAGPALIASGALAAVGAWAIAGSILLAAAVALLLHRRRKACCPPSHTAGPPGDH